MTLYHYITMAQRQKSLNNQKERLELLKTIVQQHNILYAGNCTIPNYNKHTTINNYYGLKTDQDK